MPALRVDFVLKVREIGASFANYNSWHAAYDLRKLRGKGFVHKVPKSHRYLCSASGTQAIAALLAITDKVIKPVLAGAGKPRRGRTPKHLSPVAIHYLKLQVEMRNLFGTLGIAA